MSKQFIVDRHTTPGTPALDPVAIPKVPVYDTEADAVADLSNLEENQIGFTKDTGNELAQPVDAVESGNLHAVTSNAVAETVNGIDKNVTLLYNYTSYATDEVTLAQSIENFRSIVVAVGNNEASPSVSVKEYNSEILQNYLLGMNLHDIAGYNNAYKFYIRYTFTSKTKFRIQAFNGEWSFGSLKIWGVK